MMLHEDTNFHYEAIRAIALTRYGSSDINEILTILPKIGVGSSEDWYREWFALAQRVLATVDETKLDTYSKVTIRDVFFRVSHYIFVADFFLHGNPSDPRLRQNYDLWRKYFDIANAAMDIPGEHVLIKTQHGWDVPAIIYRSQYASEDKPRPTIILGGGFDSNYEELLPWFGVSALDRGYNVVLYEGPGQPTLLHKYKQGFIYDWEKAVTPVVDYLLDNKAALPFIDTSKIALVGMSMGGYLSARAAAFEPRLCAVLCIDGIYDNGQPFRQAFARCKESLDKHDIKTCDELFDDLGPNPTSNERWIHDHSKFSFRETSGYNVLQKLAKYNMEGIADKIKMPAFIGLADKDIFFLGQPEKLAKAIGNNATLVPFTEEHAAGEHCQSGALTYLNQQMWEWFSKVVA